MGKSIPGHYLSICLLGLLILSVGLALTTGSHLMKSNDGYRSYTDPTPTSITANIVGIMIGEVGTMIMISGLLMAGFLSEGLDWHTRNALLGAGFGLLFAILFFGVLFGLA